MKAIQKVKLTVAGIETFAIADVNDKQKYIQDLLKI
jgi:hypothetical protein